MYLFQLCSTRLSALIQSVRQPKSYPCMIIGCSPQVQFKRLADLERHQNTVHFTKFIDCPHGRCGRTGKHGFTRKDHLRDHVSEVHMKDIAKQSKAPGTRWDRSKPTEYGSKRNAISERTSCVQNSVKTQVTDDRSHVAGASEPLDNNTTFVPKRTTRRLSDLPRKLNPSSAKETLVNTAQQGQDRDHKEISAVHPNLEDSKLRNARLNKDSEETVVKNIAKISDSPPSLKSSSSIEETGQSSISSQGKWPKWSADGKKMLSGSDLAESKFQGSGDDEILISSVQTYGKGSTYDLQKLSVHDSNTMSKPDLAESHILESPGGGVLISSVDSKEKDNNGPFSDENDCTKVEDDQLNANKLPSMAGLWDTIGDRTSVNHIENPNLNETTPSKDAFQASSREHFTEADRREFLQSKASGNERLHSTETQAPTIEQLVMENHLRKVAAKQQQAFREFLSKHNSNLNSLTHNDGTMQKHAEDGSNDLWDSDLNEINHSDTSQVLNQDITSARRFTEFHDNLENRFSPLSTLENREMKNVKKEHSQSSLGFGDSSETQQSRRHSPANVVENSDLKSIVVQEDIVRNLTEFGGVEVPVRRQDNVFMKTIKEKEKQHQVEVDREHSSSAGGNEFLQDSITHGNQGVSHQAHSHNNDFKVSFGDHQEEEKQSNATPVENSPKELKGLMIGAGNILDKPILDHDLEDPSNLDVVDHLSTLNGPQKSFESLLDISDTFFDDIHELQENLKKAPDDNHLSENVHVPNIEQSTQLENVHVPNIEQSTQLKSEHTKATSCKRTVKESEKADEQPRAQFHGSSSVLQVQHDSDKSLNVPAQRGVQSGNMELRIRSINRKERGIFQSFAMSALTLRFLYCLC